LRKDASEVCAAHRANQFIEFKLDGVTITVLAIFDSEIPSGIVVPVVDDHLPGIAET
jgi:hypothetical protein